MRCSAAERVREGGHRRTERDDPAELSDDFLFADVRLGCLLEKTKEERGGIKG